MDVGSVDVGDLELGTNYYWRVDEINNADPNSPWRGDVWSFWIPPVSAYEPSPSDGAKFVFADTDLSWTAGMNAKLHYVYFGDNFDDVNSATTGELATSTTFAPGTLESGKTYYWRIDGVDDVDPAQLWKGRIWSFTAPGVAPIGQPSDVSVHFLGWTPEGEALVRVSGGERANIYVALLGEAFVPWAVATGSGDVRYSPDGLLVAVDHTIYDPSSGLAVVELPPGEFIGWSADSRYFAVGGDPDDQVPRVLAWDRETGRFEEATLAVTGIWSSQGHRLAYGLDRH
ncbi:MAG: hypothetical protein IIB89_01200, partial [Chloroflexi bacterium]|nr:hypothetical protein [Chloroflexota bacterium]